MSKKLRRVLSLAPSNTTTSCSTHAANKSECQTLSHLNKLEELTTCVFCTDTFTEPLLLPCHHTFCTKCVQKMMNSQTDQFLCPIDRKAIKVPAFGADAFEQDTRVEQLVSIRDNMEEEVSLNHSREECDSTIAEIDISLNWLMKGIKDVEHSSALAQQGVHEMFRSIYKKVRTKEEEFLSDVQQKCKLHLSYLEYEKLRLIEIKKNRMKKFNQFCHKKTSRGFFTSGDTSQLSKLSPNNIAVSPDSSAMSSDSTAMSSDSTAALVDSIMSCDIPVQHIEFLPCQEKLEMLDSYLEGLGQLSWEFSLDMKLNRDLGSLEEYPYGVEIKVHNNNGFVEPSVISKCSWGDKYVIASRHGNKLMIVDKSFNIEKIIEGGEGEGSKFQSISDVVTFGNNMYLSDHVGCQVVLLSSEGVVIKSFGKQGSGQGELNKPLGLAVTSNGKKVMVTDSLNHRVQVLSHNLQKCVKTITTTSTNSGGGDDVMGFSFPSGVAVDHRDNVYVCDTKHNRVVVLNKEGKFQRSFQLSGGISNPCGIAVTSDNKVLVMNEENILVVCDAHSGALLARVSGISDRNGDVVGFKKLNGITVEGTDKIFVTDLNSNSVFMF